MSQSTSAVDFPQEKLTRRGLLGGIGMAVGLVGGSTVFRYAAYAQSMAAIEPIQPFRFVHLTDTQLGYLGDANRSVLGSLQLALKAIGALSPAPDFILVTGDLTQGTPSDRERKNRLVFFQQTLKAVKIPFYTVPGEHDALMDRGKVYQTVMGDLRYGFLHKGVQFIGLDNVSQGFFLGKDQLAWFNGQIEKMDVTRPLILFCHAPLYNVFAPWNWYTFDGDILRAMLSRFRRVTVLYGHVHQIIAHTTQNIRHYAGLPTAWPLPEPGSLVELKPWPQGATHPYLGLGLRVVDVLASGDLKLTNLLLSEVSHVSALE
ncbi:MAG: metallophosphoesterase family protein [Sulfobacillus sp.]